jgi:hypothetical protein
MTVSMTLCSANSIIFSILVFIQFQLTDPTLVKMISSVINFDFLNLKDKKICL